MTNTATELRVRLLDQKMAAQLCVPAGFPAPLLSEELCVTAFREAGVAITAALGQAIRAGLEQFRAQPQADVLIEAHGQAPVPGQDGRLEWAPGFDPGQRQVATQANGRIDFYNQSAFVRVESGQVIARLVPPTPGEDGVDVTGRVLAARAGCAVDLALDHSVLCDAHGQLIPQAAGVLHFGGRNLAVHTSLRIDGCVDFTTGNVKFDGDVEVLRGVRDCFTVQASGHLIVRGPVEAATIEVGQDFTAGTGVAGKGKGRLRVGGCLRARYLDQVTGTIEHDAQIEHEVIHCQLDVRGDLLIPQGALIGGQVRVAGRVVVADLGSPVGDQTVLILAPPSQILAVLLSAESSMQQIRQELDGYQQQILTLQSAGPRASPAQKEQITVLLCEQAMLQEKLDRLTQKHHSLEQALRQQWRCDVTVHQCLHPGTRLVVGGTALVFHEARRGPVCIRQNTQGQVVFQNPKTGQSTPAHDLARVEAAGPLPEF